MVSELTPTEEELTSVDTEGNTCVFYAAAALHLDLVKYLVELIVRLPLLGESLLNLCRQHLL